MELEAANLRVLLGGRVLLDGVSFKLGVGEHALLLGWAGSGKTLVLKALAGLLPVSSGRVLWDGDPLDTLGPTELSRRQSAFGMVFQTDALFDSMNVLANVELPLRRRGVDRSSAQKRAREVLGQVGLAHAEHLHPERLSGGMRKRAGLARALAARPQVLLADDPLSGLDPATGAGVTSLIAQASEGRTLLWAAPEPPPHLELPRWLWLSEGRLTYDGPPRPELLGEKSGAF